MPGRKVPLVTDEFYHILNRGVASQRVFSNAWHYKRMLGLIKYYQHVNTPGRYSTFNALPNNKKNNIYFDMDKHSEKFIKIFSYCLMPTHLHLLVKQTYDEGISFFMSKLTNSYTKYFNSRMNRKGPLFQGKFKSVRIITEEQFLHVSRYIHLNPFSSHVVKTLDELLKYRYSSLPEYLQNGNFNICETELVLSQFGCTEDYKEFVLDQADHQRQLEFIKHLVIE
jgi:putative transposase